MSCCSHSAVSYYTEPGYVYTKLILSEAYWANAASPNTSAISSTTVRARLNIDLSCLICVDSSTLPVSHSAVGSPHGAAVAFIQHYASFSGIASNENLDRQNNRRAYDTGITLGVNSVLRNDENGVHHQSPGPFDVFLHSGASLELDIRERCCEERLKPASFSFPPYCVS